MHVGEHEISVELIDSANASSTSQFILTVHPAPKLDEAPPETIEIKIN